MPPFPQPLSLRADPIQPGPARWRRRAFRAGSLAALLGLLAASSHAAFAADRSVAKATSKRTVAVVTPALQAAETAVTIAPGTAVSLTYSLAFTVLAPASDIPAGQDVLRALSEAVAEASVATTTASPQLSGAIRELEGATEPLAVLNPALDATVEQAAESLDQGADQYGEQIQPLDRTLAAEGAILRGLKSR